MICTVKNVYKKLSLSIVDDDDVDVVEKNQTCQSYHCIDQFLNQFAEMPTHVVCNF